jgi:4-hydroxy-tetrahydrodipicolinate synthase
MRAGEFDPESFANLLDHMSAGVDGYTLLGSTGEAPSMSRDERMSIAEQALAMTPEGMTVVVGITNTAIADAVELARHAEANGAGAVLCASPFYFENAPDGLLGFFAEIDAAIGIDLVLYDNPAATKTKLQAQWVVDWSRQLEHLTAVKLTDQALEKIGIWQQAGLRVIGGDDPINFRYLAGGVDGIMMIAPAIFPAAYAEAWRLIGEGRMEDALAVFSAEVLPFLHVFGIGDEIVTTKALLDDIGVFASDECRVPLTPVDAKRRALLRAAYDVASAATVARTGSERSSA